MAKIYTLEGHHKKPAASRGPSGKTLQALASSFEFHPALDTVFLDGYYQGDIEQAAFCFDIFLNVTAREFPRLQSAGTDRNWRAVKRLAHKMKPNFRMVGLSELYRLLEKIESLAAKEPPDESALQRLLYMTDLKFRRFLPIIISERERMNGDLPPAA